MKNPSSKHASRAAGARTSQVHRAKRSVARRAADPVAAARAAAFTDEHPARAFAHFRPLAAAVGLDELSPFTGQPLLMLANVKTALTAVEPHLAAAVAQLPGARLQEIFELPSLVMALEYATGRVPVAQLSVGEITNLLAEGAPWRELMLQYLEVVSHPLLGLVPAERVRKIREGKGKLDKAQDFVALPGVFAEFETALAHKHPFPANKLSLLSTLGGTLVNEIRPGNAPVEVAKRSSESLLRDQFAQLVVDRYDHLQVLAAVAVGRRAADALLPALRSFVRGSATSEAAPPPSVAGAAAAAAASDGAKPG